MPITVEELQRGLVEHDDGVLKAGAHRPGREFCALEFSAMLRGKPWSDAPGDLPDLRPLNDGPWSSDAARTRALVPVMAAFWDWRVWPAARQRACVERIVLRTVQRIVSRLPGLSEPIRQQCQDAQSLTDARAAARVAAKAVESVEAGASAWVAARAVVAVEAGAAEVAAEAAAEAAVEAALATDDDAAAAAAEVAEVEALVAAEAVEAGATVGTVVLQTACQLWVDAANA